MAKKEKVQAEPVVQAMQKPIEFTELKTFIQEQIRHQSASYDMIYKNYFMDTSERAIKLKQAKEDWRTNIKSPLTVMFIDKATNVVLKVGGRFVVTDLFSDTRGDDSEKITQEMIDLVDYVMKQDKNKSTMTDIVKDMMSIGSGITKTSYLQNKRTAEYIDYSGKKKEVVKTNDTVLFDYVSSYNFFPYYHTSNLEDAVFVAERFLMKRSSIEAILKKNSANFDWKKVTEGGYDYVDERDFNAIKNGIPYYGFAMGEHGDRRIDDWYKIKDKEKTFEVIELHTQTHTWMFINGIEVGPFESIEQKVLFDYRYRMIHFRKLSGSVKAIGLGHYLTALQNEYDAITNARIDNVLLAVNKMFIVSPDSNLAMNGDKIKMGPGMVIKAEPNDIEPVNLGEVPGSSYRETEGIFGLAQAVSGTTSMQLGLQNKVERVSGSSQMLKEALDDQLIEPIGSIANMNAKLFKDIVVLTLAYMSREQLDKILGKDNKLKSVDIQTIINDYEFSFEVDSESVKNSAVTLQLLINYLSTVAGMVDKKGMPIADVRSVSSKIREALGLPTDVELTQDDLVMLTGAAGGAPKDGEAALTALQTMGAGGDLGELATNPTGINS